MEGRGVKAKGKMVLTTCKACRRPLTNPASIKHGLGPSCLRRAVKSGTAPLDALEELKEWQRSKPKAQKPKAMKAAALQSNNRDLFEQARQVAIEALKSAANECAVLGVMFELNIKE